MENFRSDSRDDRDGFRGRSGGSRFGGRSGGFGGGRGGFRGRDSGGYGRDRERRPLEMHEATCAKCGKQCQVPFKPTGDKPVYCSDCFRNEDPRNKSSGASPEQFNQINEKLDKIMKALNLE